MYLVAELKVTRVPSSLKMTAEIKTLTEMVKSIPESGRKNIKRLI